MEKSLGLSPGEREQYDRDGYVVREGVLDESELGDLRDACASLCARLVAHSRETRKVDVSEFYVFEMDEPLNVMLKWEPGDRRVLQGVEPLVHLDRTLEHYGMHPALSEPAKELLDLDEVALFTEKLNIKQRGVGGAYALHRDLPYWLPDADDAHRMITVLLALDEAAAENGALEVLPGSHLVDDLPSRQSELEFERNELDAEQMDLSAMVTVEMTAGSAVFFGPMLVHRSGANRASTDRRALLYTYQRAGQRDQRDINREWFEQVGTL